MQKRSSSRIAGRREHMRVVLLYDSSDNSLGCRYRALGTHRAVGCDCSTGKLDAHSSVIARLPIFTRQDHDRLKWFSHQGESKQAYLSPVGNRPCYPVGAPRGVRLP
jgi:hypothetical protein